VFTGAGGRDAGVLGAGVAVVARIGREDTAALLARVHGARVIVIASKRRVDAGPCGHQTRVNSAGVLVIACLPLELAHPCSAVAAINGARVLVVADRHIVPAPGQGRIAHVNGAGIAVVTVLRVELALARGLVAGVIRTGVAVVAHPGRMGARPGGRDAGIHGAWDPVIAVHGGLDVALALGLVAQPLETLVAHIGAIRIRGALERATCVRVVVRDEVAAASRVAQVLCALVAVATQERLVDASPLCRVAAIQRARVAVIAVQRSVLACTELAGLRVQGIGVALVNGAWVGILAVHGQKLAHMVCCVARIGGAGVVVVALLVLLARAIRPRLPHVDAT